jgi:hypothetical protein
VSRQCLCTFYAMEIWWLQVQEDGIFAPFDPAAETPEATAERTWIEARLNMERAKRARAHQPAPLDATLATVHEAWKRERRAPAAAAAAAATRRAAEAAAAGRAEVEAANDEMLRVAQAEHDAAVASACFVRLAHGQPQRVHRSATSLHAT